MTCSNHNEPSLVALIAVAFSHLSTNLIDHLHGLGYTDVELHHFLNVLRFVSADGVRSAVIARGSGLTQQAISLQVAELEQRGYVERVPDPTDGRARLVRWSARGLELALAGETWIQNVETGLANDVGPAALEQARRTLTTINDKDS